MFLIDRLALGQVINVTECAKGHAILRRSDSGAGYIVMELQWDRLYCDGVTVGHVIYVTEWQWDRLYCDGVTAGKVIL